MSFLRLLFFSSTVSHPFIYPVPVPRITKFSSARCTRVSSTGSRLSPRVCCRLSTLAPSRDAILPPVLSDFLARFPLLSAFQTPSGLSYPSPVTSSRLPCFWSMPFPLRVSSLSSPSSSSSRSTPRVAAGFPRTPVPVAPPYIKRSERSSRAGRRRIDRQVARPLFAGTLERKRETREGEERKNEGGGSKTLKGNGKGRGCDEDKLRDISDGKRDGRKEDG